MRTVEIGRKQEIETGPATVLCSVDGEIREYDIEVMEIDWNQQDTNKCFTIQVTDPDLLEKTGGIVQGMSGSPILQNGRADRSRYSCVRFRRSQRIRSFY